MRILGTMKKKSRAWLSLPLILALLLGIAVAPASAARGEPMNGSAFAEKLAGLGQGAEGSTLVVQTRNDSPLADDFGAAAKVEGFNGWHILRYANASAASAALAKLGAQADVVSARVSQRVSLAEPFISASGKSNSAPSEPMSWGAPMVGSPELKKALEDASLPKVTVAILDTGLDFDHPYFKEHADRVIRRRDQYYAAVDRYGHGTHVAGIICDNAPGNVRVMPYKVLDDYGYGDDYTIAAAICAAADNGADVISMSLGGWAEPDDPMIGAVKYATRRGTAVVVAAGNESDDAKYYSPACTPEAITVAALNKDGTPAYFTNYGDIVDLAGPGGYASLGDMENSINSTTPASTGALYQRWAGTSMACPFVSAAAATIKAMHPEYAPADIESALKDTAGVPGSWDTSYGAGILNCRALTDLPALDRPVSTAKVIPGTSYASTPLNWFLYIVCFGWLWM